MRIGLISDTHIPTAGRDLWPQVYDALRGVDLIMHAGDDALVGLRGSLAIFDRVASRDRRLVVLERGGHRLPWGPAHRRVWEEVARWIGGHAERSAPSRPAAARCGDRPPRG